MNFLRKISSVARRWLRASLSGLDWWLSVRWRALLTWAACALLAAGAYRLAFVGPNPPGPRLIELLSTLAPAPLSVWIAGFAARGARTVIHSGFAPIILRLGMWRILLWWTVAPIASHLFVLHGASIGFPGYFSLVVASGIVQVGLPALVMMGRRTRLWMALIAGATYGVAGYLIVRNYALFSVLSDWLWPITFTIAGAVLIYGTSLLPRPPAETPGVGDGTATRAGEMAAIPRES